MKIIKSVLLIIALTGTSTAFAELEELGEEELDEQTAKEGITIDLAFRWRIGEIYWDPHNKNTDKSRVAPSPTLPPPVQPIEYVLPD